MGCTSSITVCCRRRDLGFEPFRMGEQFLIDAPIEQVGDGRLGEGRLQAVDFPAPRGPSEKKSFAFGHLRPLAYTRPLFDKKQRPKGHFAWL
jgi:hypothetical protein